MLLNRSATKKFILQRQSIVRPGWKFERVSAQALDDLEYKLQRIIDSSLKGHPSKGKTFMQVL